MTNGTSQGLFIVVAIVIFGIFVGLAYTAFGKEGLSNDLKNLFENATEQAQDNLISNKKEKLFIETGYLDMNNNPNLTLIKNIENNSSILSSDGSGGGLAFPTKDFSEFGKTYEFRFKITLNSGTVDTLGGHIDMSTSEDILVKINGVEQEMKDYYVANTWANGVPVNMEQGETITVSVIFKKTLQDNLRPDNPVKIQPNRNYYLGYDKPNGLNFGYGKPYSVTIDNIEIIEYK